MIVDIGNVLFVLLVRFAYVPRDVGIDERGYMYGWHRTDNDADWKKVKVKNLGGEYFRGCHSEKYAYIIKTCRRISQYENFYGMENDVEGEHPSRQHFKITINKPACIAFDVIFGIQYGIGNLGFTYLSPAVRLDVMQKGACYFACTVFGTTRYGYIQ